MIPMYVLLQVGLHAIYYMNDYAYWTYMPQGFRSRLKAYDHYMTILTGCQPELSLLDVSKRLSLLDVNLNYPY